MPSRFDRDYSIWFDVGDLVYVLDYSTGQRDVGTVMSEEITDGKRRWYEVSFQGTIETCSIDRLKHVVFKRRKELENDQSKQDYEVSESRQRDSNDHSEV